MPTLRCLTCGGRFESRLADAMQYFHACPPLSRAELQAEVTAGRIVLRAGETVDSAMARRAFERADKRDENIEDAGDRRGAAARIKAAGLGVVSVPDV